MVKTLEAFGVKVTIDSNSGLYDVRGTEHQIREVMDYLDGNDFHNDGGAMEAVFGLKKAKVINRLFVFLEGENKGYLPLTVEA